MGLRLFIDRKLSGLPRVVEYLVRGMSVGHDGIPDEVVEASTRPTKTFRAEASVAHGRRERCTWLKAPGKVPVVEADANACCTKDGHLSSNLPVTTPGECTKPDRTALFVGMPLIEGEPGAMLMARRNPPTLQQFDPFTQLDTTELKLLKPAPSEVAELIGRTGGHMPLGRPDPLDVDRCITLVGRSNPAFDQIVLHMDAVVEGDPQRIGSVAELNMQLWSLTLMQFGSNETQYAPTHTVGKSYHQAWLVVLHALIARILLWSKLSRAVERGPSYRRGRGWVVSGAVETRPPVAVGQESIPIQPKGVAHGPCFQHPTMGGGIDRHSCSSLQSFMGLRCTTSR